MSALLVAGTATSSVLIASTEGSDIDLGVCEVGSAMEHLLDACLVSSLILVHHSLCHKDESGIQGRHSAGAPLQT